MGRAPNAKDSRRIKLVNSQRLLDTFLELVRIDSPSGEEEAIANHLAEKLSRLGLAVEPDAIHNLVARLPGRGQPVMLAAHMDTVMPGRGIRPVVQDGIIRSDGSTILGADDKAGIAIILETLAVLAESGQPHPPLEVVITVQEEVGLNGARSLDRSRLESQLGISLDAGGPPGQIVVSAPTHDLVTAVVLGRAAHAGANPEAGINAIKVAAEAIHNMPLGRIDAETTANIGIIQGGRARNIVPDRVELTGEARSRNVARLDAQTAAMRRALEDAARAFETTVEIDIARSYLGYELGPDEPMVHALSAACRAEGVEPQLVPTGGGSDANIFNADGRQVVNLSMGASGEHTTHEQVAVNDMVMCARIVLRCLRSLAG